MRKLWCRGDKKLGQIGFFSCFLFSGVFSTQKCSLSSLSLGMASSFLASLLATAFWELSGIRHIILELFCVIVSGQRLANDHAYENWFLQIVLVVAYAHGKVL